MAMMVGDDFRFLFLFVTGDEFPDADEDLLRALADAWELVGRRLREELAPELCRAITQVRSTFDGHAAEAFVAAMAPFVTGNANVVDALAAFCFEVAVVLRRLALDVEYMKYVITLELSTLESEFQWAFTVSALLAPIAMVWLASRTTMAETALEALLDWFAERLVTLGATTSLERATLIGVTSSMSNQVLVTVGAQGLQFRKGTRSAWTREYISDAAVVGTVGLSMAPMAYALGRRVAKSLTELLDDVFGRAHGALDWHRAFAHGVAHVFHESMHEGSTATVANAILAHQLVVSWADFTAGASSGVARASGHLLGQVVGVLTLAAAPGLVLHAAHGQTDTEAAAKSVAESVLPKAERPEMTSKPPRRRLDIAAIASGFPATILDDPNRRKAAEDIVAGTHHVDRLRQTGEYHNVLRSVAGTAEGSGTGKATQLSLRFAGELDTHLPPVAPGGAPLAAHAPSVESTWSEPENERAEVHYGLDLWAPGFRKVAAATDARQVFAALDFPRRSGLPEGTAPGSAFSALPPEVVGKGWLETVRDRIDKAGRGAHAVVFARSNVDQPAPDRQGSIWHFVHEARGVRLKRYDGSPADALPDDTGPAFAVGLDAEDRAVIADTVDARWNAADFDGRMAKAETALSKLTAGERRRRLHLAATISWAAGDLRELTETRRFAFIRLVTQPLGRTEPDIDDIERLAAGLTERLVITWPDEDDSGSWTFRRIARSALETEEVQIDLLGDEDTAIARDVVETVFDRPTLERLALLPAVFRMIVHEVRTKDEETAHELAVAMASDLGLANPEFAQQYVRDQAGLLEADTLAFKAPGALAGARAIVARTHNLARLGLLGVSREVTVLVAGKLRESEDKALAYSRRLARFLDTTTPERPSHSSLWTDDSIVASGRRAAETLDPAKLPEVRPRALAIVLRHASAPELVRTPGLREAMVSMIAEVLLGPGPFGQKRAKAVGLAREISKDLGLGWSQENFERAVDAARNSPKPPQAVLDHARDWVGRRHDPDKFEDVTEQEVIGVVAVTVHDTGVPVDDGLTEAVAAAIADGLRTEAQDPHQWLEDLTGEAAREWVRARNAETAADLAGSERFTRIRDELREALDADDKIPYPDLYGEYLYNFWWDSKNPRGLWRRTTLDDYRKEQPKWEIVLDLDALAATEGEDWSWKRARLLGPDHRRGLVELSRGGADATVVREFDLERRAFVEDGFQLPAGTNEVRWIDEGRIYVGTDFGAGSLTNSGYPRVIKEWRRGTPLSEATTVYEGEPGDASVFAYHHSTPGYERDFVGKWIDYHRSEEFLRTPGGLIRIEVPDGAETSVHREWLLIKLNSPWAVAGREHRAGTLLAANFDAYLAGERDLTVLFEPEQRVSLQSYDWTSDHLLLTTLSDVHTRLLVLTPHEGAWHAEPLAGVPANSIAEIMDTGPGNSNEYLLRTFGFTQPSTLTYGEIGGEPETLRQATARFDAEGMTVDQYFAVSLDGTKIPYFVVRPRDPHGPTLLSGYGGFAYSNLPSYSASIGRGWLARGGTYVLANIRGGGEYGPEWHTPTVKEGRHLVYEDFAAVADDLVKREITTPERLGLRGGSSGGLLTGVMLTRYPEQFGAVISQIPLLDLRRYHLLLKGASWMGEYGNPDNPAEWAYLEPNSPYENIYSGREYPPTLILSRRLDDRVHPGHARKMVAKMLEQGHHVRFYEAKGGHEGVTNEDFAFEAALGFEFLWSELTGAGPAEVPSQTGRAPGAADLRHQ